jgi:uncharacterized protein
MNKITRRRFLQFIGGGASAVALSSFKSGEALFVPAAQAGISEVLIPVRLPHPLPIYTEKNSWLATNIGGVGVIKTPTDPVNLTEYTVLDEVVIPPGYEYYVIVSWGDRPFSDRHQYVGYNHDYTAFVPLKGSIHDGCLYINHEYISCPFSKLAPDTPSNIASLEGVFESFLPVVGFDLPTTRDRQLMGEMLYNCGGTVVRVRRTRRRGEETRYQVVAGDAKNRRIHGLSGLEINADRPATDPYRTVTSWGLLAHQQGDSNYLTGTGPAATDVLEDVNADGLGNRIIGTAFNCSGARTPWGTVLSAEENFQGSTTFFIGVQEAVLPNGSQTGYIAGTSGAEFGLVGEKYGWMVEIDPKNPGSRAKKHTALGRFRHENVAMRVKLGKPLVVYLGDDRRGGHTWKYVSRASVKHPCDPANSALLTEGTLYVAKFRADGTGIWIPLALDTPVDPNSPTVLSSAERAERADGKAQRDGLVLLPKRNGIAGQTSDGGSLAVTLSGVSSPLALTEAQALDSYKTKGGTKPAGTVRLSDYYTSQGALLCDAFLAANLIGGTPCARPEDIEIHPVTKQVFITMTDGVAGSDGYPDSRIFVLGKYSAAIDATQPHGGLYKIIEDSPDGAGTTFTWDRFLQGGEVGAQDGTGFAAIDNLVFDEQGNLWIVTDMSTERHNGFDLGVNPTPRTIDHTVINDTANDLVGVFGNNWMFYVPTIGPAAGQVVPFAYGPPRCEMTGPTFVGDTLFLSVQHPSEDSIPNDGTPASTLNRDLELLALNGSTFTQNRTVPRGSNWPSNIGGDALGAPKPATIGIRRVNGGPFIPGEDFE